MSRRERTWYQSQIPDSNAGKIVTGTFSAGRKFILCQTYYFILFTISKTDFPLNWISFLVVNSLSKPIEFSYGTEPGAALRVRQQQSASQVVSPLRQSVRRSLLVEVQVPSE